MSRRRLKPEIRKDRILRAAVDAAVDIGFQRLTRQAVADQAQVSVGLINRYYSTMPKLRRAVMRYAVKHRLLGIIATGVVMGNKQAGKAPEDVQRLALSRAFNISKGGQDDAL